VGGGREGEGVRGDKAREVRMGMWEGEEEVGDREWGVEGKEGLGRGGGGGGEVGEWRTSWRISEGKERLGGGKWSY